MPIIWPVNDYLTPAQMSALVEHLDKLGPNVLIDEVDTTARILGALSLNKDFLIESILGGVSEAHHETKNAHVFVLHETSHYLIRAVVWRSSDGTLDEAFLYEGAHDHNFHLMTVGYLGPGYTTELFTYAEATHPLSIGQTIPITCHGQVQLEQGVVLLLEANSDIHTQRPPGDLSVTINVISYSQKDRWQYLFDISNERDGATVVSHLAARVSQNERELLESLEDVI